ncbi:glycoside hydrolase family 10 protein [Arundinibacter roseus]|uniref:Glycoside hydrolase n=1 Tax=Arundinibacter roseus TaxID=2070510 RepID=A0A4R4K0T1_9BACT|nr:family 10 glycosylhydrolase [Arundinibacter roseus]TDB60830.1 glycoside hydrolase [Arundinibacter roseus]
MKKSCLDFVSFFILFHFLGACQAQPFTPEPTKPPKREFRAVWVATVDNIDWPSQKNLTPDQQRQEFTDLLDFYKSLGMNALFVQVRAAGDAFYARSNEPWSEWLTGEQGRAPRPFYDPLDYMVKEAHQRGLEFHAWLNLNRLVHRSSTSVSSRNLSKTHPEWILSYDGAKLFNFGIPEVRQYITDMTVNVAKNYDIDGIHFDDYFYPYSVAGQVLQDDATFKKYGQGFKNKADWRRHNVDVLIRQIHDALAETKPRLKFGISPFGVWRNQRDDPRGSLTTGGLSSYDHLFADTRKWVEEGWIDYVAPQVYFSSGFKKVPFQNLVDWWAENRFDRHLYIGQAAYRAGYKDKDVTWQNKSEIPNQVRYLRKVEAEGSIFFSSRSLRANALGFVDSLKNDMYKYPALVPAMPWKDSIPPLNPQNLKGTLQNGGVELFWEAPAQAMDGDSAWYYVIYRFEEGEKPSAQDPRRIVGISHQKRHFTDRTAVAEKKYLYYVTAVDRLHNEGRPAGPLRILIVENRLHPF